MNIASSSSNSPSMWYEVQPSLTTMRRRPSSPLLTKMPNVPSRFHTSWRVFCFSFSFRSTRELRSYTASIIVDISLFKTGIGDRKRTVAQRTKWEHDMKQKRPKQTYHFKPIRFVFVLFPGDQHFIIWVETLLNLRYLQTKWRTYWSLNHVTQAFRPFSPFLLSAIYIYIYIERR